MLFFFLWQCFLPRFSRWSTSTLMMFGKSLIATVGQTQLGGPKWYTTLLQHLEVMGTTFCQGCADNFSCFINCQDLRFQCVTLLFSAIVAFLFFLGALFPPPLHLQPLRSFPVLAGIDVFGWAVETFRTESTCSPPCGSVVLPSFHEGPN